MVPLMGAGSVHVDVIMQYILWNWDVIIIMIAFWGYIYLV